MYQIATYADGDYDHATKLFFAKRDDALKMFQFIRASKLLACVWRNGHYVRDYAPVSAIRSYRDGFERNMSFSSVARVDGLDVTVTTCLEYIN